MKTVRHLGETLNLAKLVKHYRDCARWWPGSAAFWRTQMRTAIRQYREQEADRQDADRWDEREAGRLSTREAA